MNEPGTRSQAHANHDTSVGQHNLCIRPESPAAAVLQQAVRGVQDYHNIFYHSGLSDVDPREAIHVPGGVPFGYGMLHEDADYSRQRYGAGRVNIEMQSTAGQCFRGYGLYSYEEADIEGDLDDSLASAHSFWDTYPGDTTGDTIDTIDFDAPVPLLDRDGTWRGTPPSKRTEIEHETRMQQHGHKRQASLDCLDHTVAFLDQQSLKSRPSRGTRRQRATSEDDAAVVQGSSSLKRIRLSREEREEDELRCITKPRKSKKGGSSAQPRSRHSESSQKATTREAIGSEVRRHSAHASSDLGSDSSSRVLSSPASSLGRYRLKKKDSVPVLSLVELMTPPPPPSRSTRQSDEAVHGSADWQDDDAQGQAEHPVNEHRRRSRRLRASDVKGQNQMQEHVEQPDVNEDVESDAIRPGRGRSQKGLKHALKEEPEDILGPTRAQDRGTRTFPPHWEVHPEFPLLYQRYSVPSSVSPEVLEMLLRHVDSASVDEKFRDIVNRAHRCLGTFNKPRSILDLYTPRWVKGVSAQKVGMCPVCYEDGKVKFLKTKFSAYNYHLQNFHGISALTGLPFTPPSHFRLKPRPHSRPTERAEIIQGHCHSCRKWIDMQGPRETEVKVAEIFWWKHAQACHRKSTTPVGVDGFFVQDVWFERVRGVLQLIDGYEGEIGKLQAGNK
ncbi:hypothetical protein PHSY_001315 [Pseudozyma hubeiensis SY62]|uniref:Transcription regulator Rua1 C-terminal domain-containing protein n=1 Tax=Pseudozyma hubeiensis (strain SY62) TaxID=1305764 RepID=R9P6N1_PSEHS|nr:hypothetical protein PHSY_001315 [Pseudozyma hubeiensis SY62]GAC93750.1 hypothetical protein PHSY_001315 [Pseudozyma hubeiensis SY62]